MRMLRLSALLLPITAGAGLNDYQCIVTGEAFLGSTGTIAPGKNPVYVNQRFAIDRASDVITGRPFWSSNVESGRRLVLDPGAREWSYKLLSTHPTTPGGNRNVDYVVFNDMRRARRNPLSR